MAGPRMPFGFGMLPTPTGHLPPLPNADQLDIGQIMRREQMMASGAPDPNLSFGDFNKQALGNFAAQAIPQIGYSLAPIAGAIAPRVAGGAAGLLMPSPAGGQENQGSVRELQIRLKEAGYYKGKIDGQMGAETQAAHQRFQADQAAQQEREIARQRAAAEASQAEAQRAETDRQRKADEQRATERAAGEERMRSMENDVPWYRRALRDYGPPLGYAMGGLAGLLTRGKIKSGAEARSADVASRAETLMQSSPTDMPGRVARVNQFWGEGGAGSNVPFSMAPSAPRGVVSNPSAPPAASLYQPPSRVTPTDAGAVGAFGLESGISGYMGSNARERLSEAQERVRQDPSEINIRALQAELDKVAFFDFMTRFGQAGAAGYGVGLAKGAPQHTRPNVAPAEAMRLRIDQQLAKQRPHSSHRQPRDARNRFTRAPANDE